MSTISHTQKLFLIIWLPNLISLINKRHKLFKEIEPNNNSYLI